MKEISKTYARSANEELSALYKSTDGVGKWFWLGVASAVVYALLEIADAIREAK